jgi:hypothetical protein
MEDKVLKSMVGLVVTNLYVSKDAETLTLETDAGRVFHWEVEGDCCSVSWFNDVMGVSALIWKVITKVEGTGGPDDYVCEEGRHEDECIQVYGYRITTLGGYCDIVFRNASNGYYGGWMTPVEGKSVPRDATEITEDDWTA